MNKPESNERTYYRHARVEPYLQRIIVSHQYRLIYCPIPKAACTTWKTVLNPGRAVTESYHIHGSRPGFVALSTLSLGDRSHVLDSYFKFTFVRHPLSRLLSVYKDKFELASAKPSTVPYRFWRGYAEHIKEAVLDGGYCDTTWRDLTFQEFARFVCHQQPAWMNEHWHPQHLLLGGLKYDFVGRLERLRPDSAYVCSKVGLPWPLPGQEQVGIAKTGAGALLDDYYTPELEALVTEKFRQDFDQLGYHL